MSFKDQITLPESAGFLSARVIQVHPSRFCNLACRHCYSSSGPDSRESLNPEKLTEALGTLRREGYSVLSFSGGEPLLYSGFEQIAEQARQLGFQVNLVTNGSPLNSKTLKILKRFAHTVAVSLDGGPQNHNDIRGNRLAFEWADRALRRLTETDLRTGISYCVSRPSLTDMPWVVDYATELGLRLVQFHPFSPVGRGKSVRNELALSSDDKLRAYLVAEILKSPKGPRVKCDLAPAEHLRASRFQYPVLHQGLANDQLSLSDIVNPLVIDEQGVLLPFSLGVKPELAIAELNFGANDLAEQVRAYKCCRASEIIKLLSSTFDTLAGRGLEMVDWFHLVLETSLKIRPEPPHERAVSSLNQFVKIIRKTSPTTPG